MAKKKTNTQQILMNSAMAFGGGIGAELVSDLIADNAPEIVQKNPKITELAPAGIGVGLLFLMPGKMDPLAYGMIGASGAGMADDLIGGMQGFNRLTLNGNDIGDEYAKGQEFIEKKMKEGFTMNGDGEYQGMGY